MIKEIYLKADDDDDNDDDHDEDPIVEWDED